MNRIHDLTFGERLAVLETIVLDMKAEQIDINGKLDELLALRNRGVGAFWLVSTLFGATVFGVVSFVLSIFKGH